MKDKLSLQQAKPSLVEKTIKPIKVFNSMKEILFDIFSLDIDKKTNKAKPLKLLASHETAIKNIKLNDQLTEVELKTLTNLVRENDVEFKVLLQLAISAEMCNYSEIKRKLIIICVSIVSSLEFLNPLNAVDNIFEGMLSEYIDHKDSVGILNAQLKKKFESRAEGIKKRIQGNKAKESRNVVTGEDGNSDKPKGMTLVQLESLRKNIQVLSCLWCLEFGKSKPDLILDWLYKILSEDNNTKEYQSVPYFLAKQLSASNRHSLVESISHFREKELSAEKLYWNEQQKAHQLSEKNIELTSKFSSLKESIALKETQIIELTKKIEFLKKQSETDVLHVKAERVHLKDDTGKVKSKAINLLEEDVLPTLKTSLKGLRKDEPKVSFAVDKIDLVIEDIEGALQWFKK
ncbi:hypothetical protein [Pseudoalteromonas sp. NZS11]|uniref:hypothetical protein n=1 Tax=Pseudoalteromonas sp. NZS11 TaxID=2792049 RepID=UPI0018CE6D58|nr:hypothetical protein [Pseudoalteromonas sp. NZS11]MBH0080184.1 hypothetical protein [Pseudoalteromonas sp. NZS11]